MEDHHQWHDPLLLTDVSYQQQQSSSNCIPSIRQSSKSPRMEKSAGVSWHPDIVESTSPSYYSDSKPSNLSTGRSMLGFSLTTPDLVVCAGSPDIPERAAENEMGTSIVISLEEGINGFEPVVSRDRSEGPNFSSFWRSSIEVDQLADTTSFELAPVTERTSTEKKESEDPLLISINAGSEDKEFFLEGMTFSEDDYFSGGEVIRTDADIGDGGDCLTLYRTARFGNLSYKFPFLEPGKYLIDLHFAEIVFTEGPPGMRTFDIFLQEEKVVSQLDIFARVGANKPLILPDIEVLVKSDEGLSIRLARVSCSPIISGISVRKVLSISSTNTESSKVKEITQFTDLEKKEVISSV